MANIPIELYNKIEESVGKEKAVEIAKIIEDTINHLDERVVEETKKRKIELRDELRKELATKEDILLVRQEIETVRQELNGKIESLRQELKGEIKVLKMWIFFLGALMVVLNQNSLELIARLLGSIFK
ncbi:MULTISPECIES: hypothetical protein [unclassified Hydrogenobaculum]|uniref:hypothetical protein n=1 Tax=unclassified Hydrogenobaculum TaxID=2622382 RepID=UPI0001C5220E|nr:MULTISPECIES: hypothetical protein [unclassified Hydrogenobaculum]AEF19898.1 hypothetical protein Hyd3684_1519 [Hydrogenobaculum sp. 3684]AEG47184.1 hypothetical protein HydSHO_1522 [Hydrogenobaculum sp. SHO]AGG15832.1 hypothetical protein HydHO_1524 [Hydrogenobaculum sp. HO]AGH94132.1 hypothetical protein HydSN_1567 [Hydrogenobaculum sp. SN]